MATNVKLTWDFLRQFNFRDPPKICLGRSSEVMEKYEEHKKELKDNGIIIDDYINNKYFRDNTHKFCLDKNIFPYYCDSNIEHYVMWIRCGEKISENNFKEFICNKLFDGDFCEMKQKCIYFQNITALQSIKGVNHLHVFILR